MRKHFAKSVAWVLALAMLVCCGPVFTVSAAAEYPNTHVNTGNMAADLVAVALTQVGYCEGSLSGNPAYAASDNVQKYGLWYDNNVDYIGVQRAAWCAAFVSWCANQAGIPSSIVYYHAYCPYGVNWFKNQGRFQYAASRGGSYVPKAGDIVYFAPSGSSTSSHIGIVRYVSNGYVYTVEGNTSGQNGEVNEGGGVFLKSYSLSYSRLYGYGIPNYQDNSGHTITFDSNGGSSVASVTVQDGGTLTAPANPTRYGFNFVGWYCNQELTDPYDFSTPVPYSFTLYAKWEEAYWGANTDLMPVDGLLQLNDYESSGQYIWPYYNDDGSVTMYNGVTNDSNWSWPSAYMTYENSVDSGNDAYIYVKYNATAKFNATIDYLDSDGNAQSVTLSQLAGKGDNDLPAGYNEFFVNFGQYVYDQGHLTTSDGSTHSRNVKYTKVTYYVVGGLDEYVKLYDMKFTPAFEIDDPNENLMTNDITQNGGYGSYVYDNGKLTVNSRTDVGYTITLNTNKTFNPSDMGYLLAHINSDVPFNVSMTLTRADGDAVMELRKEFYPIFGLAEAPDALPAGSWEPAMDLNGYFAWNGGAISETTVKSVTISLVGQGTLTMDALQAHRGIVTETIADGLYAADSIWPPIGSMLPVSGELVYEDFQGTGESVWDYYNDDGSVTLYNTVDAMSYSWPCGYMTFEHVADLNATPCIHLNFRCDSAFNSEITYLDDNGESHTVNLSTVAGLETTDFEAGTHDLYLDMAAYLETQGHTPASGKLKITKVAYYVVGTKDSYVRLYAMDFTAAPAVPTVTYNSINLSLAGDIGLNIYVTLNDVLLADPDARMVFTYGDKTQTVYLSAATETENGLMFTCKLWVTEMAEDVSVQMYGSDGAVGDIKTTGVKKYCDKVFSLVEQSADYAAAFETTLPLLKAMLNYGAAAQAQFTTDSAEEYANVDLAEADKTLNSDYEYESFKHVIAGSEEGISITGVNLVLDSTTSIRYTFTLDGTKPIDAYTFVVDGVEVTPVSAGSNTYYVQKEGVMSDKLDVQYTCVVGGLSVSYSALSYVRQVNRNYADDEVMIRFADALYAYSQAADAYVG